jgi:hypothetical protein
MASNEIVSEEAEEREFVTNPKNQYVAAGIVSGLASLSIGTTKNYNLSCGVSSKRDIRFVFLKFRELYYANLKKKSNEI